MVEIAAYIMCYKRNQQVIFLMYCNLFQNTEEWELW